MRFSTPALLSLLALLAAPAFAKSDFPAKLDTACNNQGRVPPNPSALARGTGVPFADCALCHTFNTNNGSFPTGSNVNSNGTAYKRGNLDPFCVVAVVNRPPVLAPIGNQAVSAGTPVALLLSATDPDGDALAFSVANLPAGAVFLDGGNGMASFDWTPSQDGNYALTFGVSDGVVSDAENVVITVGNVNAPPVLAPIGDQSVLVGDTLVLALSALDPEGGALVFTAQGLPAGATLQNLGGGSAELTYMPSAAGQADVSVTVTDAGAPPESTSESFTLTATDPAAPLGPTLEFAGWNLWEGELSGKGAGAPPDSPVTLVEPTDEGVLAVVRASKSGSFEFTVRTFMAPCFVRARDADGVLGDAIGVMNAPRDCGSALYTRAKPRWRCKDGALMVRGSRAPIASTLSVVNAANNSVLMQGQADQRGQFRLDTTVPVGPMNIRLLLSSGAGQWTLGPVPVTGAGMICDRRDEDDD
jgi:hypothetical protein